MLYSPQAQLCYFGTSCFSKDSNDELKSQGLSLSHSSLFAKNNNLRGWGCKLGGRALI